MDKKKEITISGAVLSGQTKLGQYVGYFENVINENRALFEHTYKKLIDKKMDGSQKVFLTVIIRTQGKRAEGLREAFLCLEAQTDQDFEVVLAGHKVHEDHYKNIENILKELSPDMQKKVTYIQVDEGTRAVPVNYGFANARGSYISVYDDDDLLFANYVEEFHEASKFADGRLLHAFAFAQEWKENTDILGSSGYCAVGAPEAKYCEKFNPLNQLYENKCPLMSLAFPGYLFRDYGIIFNESLDIMEDWEYIMRIFPLCGVYDIEEPTSIYRLWRNIENSASVYNKDKWNKVYRQLREQICSRPLFIQDVYPQKAFEKVRKQTMPAAAYPRMSGILFCDLGNGFSDSHIVKAENRRRLPEFELIFEVPDIYKNAVRLRIDPCEYGGMILRGCTITVFYLDGTQESLALETCQHNGTACGRDIYFMHYDPMIFWTNACPVKNVKIRGYVSMEIPQDYIEREIKKKYREYQKIRLKRTKIGKLLCRISGRQCI